MVQPLEVGRGHRAGQLKCHGWFLAHYVQHCRNQGQPIWKARYAILGIQHLLRSFRGQLTRAWDAIASWQLQNPVQCRIPLPPEVGQGMALEYALAGLRHRAAGDWYWAASVLILIGFFALLRPMEMLALTAGDILVPPVGLREPLLVVVKDPKNRAYLGRCQFRTVEDAGCIAWARWYLADRPKSQRIWPGGRVSFRRFWQWGLDALSITVPYTPASLRAGGATYLYRQGVPVSSIKFKGGWCSESSLSHYIHEAMSLFVWQNISPATRQTIVARIDAHRILLETAPVQPCSRLFTPVTRSATPPRSPCFSGARSRSSKAWAPAPTATARSSSLPPRILRC